MGLVRGNGAGADRSGHGGRLHGLLHCGIGKGVLLAVFAVFVCANGQEGDHHNGDAEIAAVAVAVLDDVGETRHGNSHGENAFKGLSVL